MKDAHLESHGKKYVRLMTPVHVRGEESVDHVEVMFMESARIYRLLKKDPLYDKLLARLEAAIPAMEALNIVSESLESDVIEDVLRSIS